jgi:2-polyprenyl-6-methoxyphenol hydroxylase-like FAD-dependent oxidoreductase
MKVLVSGAGIAGLTLAFWLHRSGHEILLVEKSPSLRDEGYMIDFFGSGYDVAEKMGLLPDLEAIHYSIPRLAFVDAKGREKFSVSYAAFRRLFGGRLFNFMRGDLERVLYAKVKGSVQLRFGITVDAFWEEEEGAPAVVTFSDGTTGEFDLLVGADGVHSQVRKQAFGDAQVRDALPEDRTVAAVAVADQVPWRLVKGEGLDHLPGDPFRRRMGGDVEVDDAAAVVAQDNEAVEQAKSDGRHDAEVDGGQRADVVMKEGLPGLRRRLVAAADHVLGDRRFGQVVAEEAQLGLDAWGTPQWVLAAQAADQLTDRGVDLRPARSAA